MGEKILLRVFPRPHGRGAPPWVRVCARVHVGTAALRARGRRGRYFCLPVITAGRTRPSRRREEYTTSPLAPSERTFLKSLWRGGSNTQCQRVTDNSIYFSPVRDSSCKVAGDVSPGVDLRLGPRGQGQSILDSSMRCHPRSMSQERCGCGGFPN